MARAFPVLIRADIGSVTTGVSFGNIKGGVGLQVSDLWPNSSQRVPAYQMLGQTLYLGPDQLAQNDTLAAYGSSGGNDTMSTTVKGLAAYLVDNVCDADNGNIILTVTRATNIAQGILWQAASGLPLTASNINSLIQVQTGGASSTLNTGRSTGSVLGVLRILAGETYKVFANAVLSGASHAFASNRTPVGSFVTSTDPDYRNILPIIDTGALHLSVYAGKLKSLIGSTFQFGNSLMTYANTATLTVSGTVSTGEQVVFTNGTLVAGTTTSATAFQTTASAGTAAGVATSLATAITDAIAAGSMPGLVSAVANSNVVTVTGRIGFYTTSTGITFAWTTTPTGLYVDGSNIVPTTYLSPNSTQTLTTGQGPAVVVYDALGNVITS